MKWSLLASAVNIVICAMIGNWLAALMAFWAFCAFCACWGMSLVCALNDELSRMSTDLVAEIERLQNKQ